jgi:hypothetical protein
VLPAAATVLPATATLPGSASVLPASASPRRLPNTGPHGRLDLLAESGLVLVLSGGLVLAAERRSWSRGR